MSSIAIATTIRASLRDTLDYVDHHVGLGIDHLVLFFDDPDDPAIGVLNDNPQVTCIRCDADHWKQGEQWGPMPTIAHRLFFNADMTREWCREHGYDWLIHIDSDELLRPRTPIHDFFDRTRSDVIRFAIREMVPENWDYGNPFREATLFRKPARGIRLRVARTSCPAAFFRGEYFRGHEASKCAVRVNSSIQLMGVHAPRDEGFEIEDTEEIELLHYDAPDVEAWAHKCRLRVANRADFPVRDNRGQQFDAFAEADKRGPEAVAALYDRFYRIPRREQIILFGLGMLTRIPSPFEGPAT